MNTNIKYLIFALIFISCAQIICFKILDISSIDMTFIQVNMEDFYGNLTVQTIIPNSISDIRLVVYGSHNVWSSFKQYETLSLIKIYKLYFEPKLIFIVFTHNGYNYLKFYAREGSDWEEISLEQFNSCFNVLRRTRVFNLSTPFDTDTFMVQRQVYSVLPAYIFTPYNMFDVVMIGDFDHIIWSSTNLTDKCIRIIVHGELDKPSLLKITLLRNKGDETVKNWPEDRQLQQEIAMKRHLLMEIERKMYLSKKRRTYSRKGKETGVRNPYRQRPNFGPELDFSGKTLRCGSSIHLLSTDRQVLDSQEDNVQDGEQHYDKQSEDSDKSKETSGDSAGDEMIKNIKNKMHDLTTMINSVKNEINILGNKIENLKREAEQIDMEEEEEEEEENVQHAPVYEIKINEEILMQGLIKMEKILNGKRKELKDLQNRLSALEMMPCRANEEAIDVENMKTRIRKKIRLTQTEIYKHQYNCERQKALLEYERKMNSQESNLENTEVVENRKGNKNSKEKKKVLMKQALEQKIVYLQGVFETKVRRLNILNYELRKLDEECLEIERLEVKINLEGKKEEIMKQITEVKYKINHYQKLLDDSDESEYNEELKKQIMSSNEELLKLHEYLEKLEKIEFEIRKKEEKDVYKIRQYINNQTEQRAEPQQQPVPGPQYVELQPIQQQIPQPVPEPVQQIQQQQPVHETQSQSEPVQQQQQPLKQPVPGPQKKQPVLEPEVVTISISDDSDEDEVQETQTQPGQAQTQQQRPQAPQPAKYQPPQQPVSGPQQLQPQPFQQRQPQPFQQPGIGSYYEHYRGYTSNNNTQSQRTQHKSGIGQRKVRMQNYTPVYKQLSRVSKTSKHSSTNGKRSDQARSQQDVVVNQPRLFRPYLDEPYQPQPKQQQQQQVQHIQQPYQPGMGYHSFGNYRPYQAQQPFQQYQPQPRYPPHPFQPQVQQHHPPQYPFQHPHPYQPIQPQYQQSSHQPPQYQRQHPPQYPFQPNQPQQQTYQSGPGYQPQVVSQEGITHPQQPIQPIQPHQPIQPIHPYQPYQHPIHPYQPYQQPTQTHQPHQLHSLESGAFTPYQHQHPETYQPISQFQDQETTFGRKRTRTDESENEEILGQRSKIRRENEESTSTDDENFDAKEISDRTSECSEIDVVNVEPETQQTGVQLYENVSSESSEFIRNKPTKERTCRKELTKVRKVSFKVPSYVFPFPPGPLKSPVEIIQAEYTSQEENSEKTNEEQKGEEPPKPPTGPYDVTNKEEGEWIEDRYYGKIRGRWIRINKKKYEDRIKEL
ncbi:hypothetical protein P-, Q-rich family protein, putative [Theileria annulata]|uniref:Uncharacterized protein n=1 Tax=Theileria annulata TaxID=5874 RepID=Q4UDS0_THEAN|nr:hypothetical protein P-, Q-rich family protein, putative [Theileria annulata]CAI74769.1 hypothetical protein P-, Q-rich family protein, putative [Theileria annulata]|eukprot:XP_952501.1 hypothetical protein P-, Q-rich family protein, putative [Theileria annulata]